MIKFKNYFYLRLETQTEYEHPDGRPHWCLDYYKNEMGLYDCNGTPIVSEPDSIYILPPNTASIHKSKSGKSWLHSTIIFYADTKDMDRLGIPYMMPIHITNTTELEQLFYNMQQHNVTPSAFKDEAQEAYLKLILIFIHNMLLTYTKNYKVKRGDDLQFVRQTFINSLHINWTVEQMANMANMSKRSFQRNYMKLYGITPIADLYEARLRSAKRLLTDGFSINFIITACGFKSPQHFSTFFKRHCGMSPSNYIKKRKTSSTDIS